MRILLIGRSGQLGSSLLSLETKHEWIAQTRCELDIEDSHSVLQTIEKYKPDVLINTAAFHNLPACEKTPENAFSVNCVSVKNVAHACKSLGVLFVTFSSDYVFDGKKSEPYTEHDKATPIQMYGISRLAGECAALSVAPENTLIIRTCGLYGKKGAASKGGNFVDNRVNDALEYKEFDMGNDQIVSPTSALDLARAVLSLIEHPKHGYGIYHLVNEGACTWYEFTCSIIDFLGLDTKVQPIDRGGLSGNMRRPSYSVLANTRARALGITLPHWQDALREYLADKYLADEHLLAKLPIRD